MLLTANQRSSPFGRTPAKNTTGARHGDGRSTRVFTSASPASENGTIGELAAAAPPQATMARPFRDWVGPVEEQETVHLDMQPAVFEELDVALADLPWRATADDAFEDHATGRDAAHPGVDDLRATGLGRRDRAESEGAEDGAGEDEPRKAGSTGSWVSLQGTSGLVWTPLGTPGRCGRFPVCGQDGPRTAASRSRQ